jgi:hypothetical protein
MSDTTTTSRRPSLAIEGERLVRAKKAVMEAFPNLDPDDDAFTGTLEGETDFFEAVDIKVEQMRRDLAEAEGLRAQAEAYSRALIDRANRLELRASTVRTRLLRVMQEVGEKRITRPGYGLTVRSGGSGKVRVFDPDMLPREYVRYKLAPPPEPDLKKISEALKDPVRRAEVEFAATLDNAPDTLLVSFK